MITKIKNVLKEGFLSFGLYETVKKISISTGLYTYFMGMVNTEIKRNLRKEKEGPILYYKQRFNPQIFIETGTYKGEMIDAMKGEFKKLYSIELSDALYEEAKIKFAKEKNVELLHGDSGKILPRILETIDEPALFWLDAHYSDGITARGEVDTPIEKELKTIFSHKIKNHIIVIDDASDFNGKNDYPKKGALKNMALGNGYDFQEIGNVFGIYPY
jgi:hypothetical protein